MDTYQKTARTTPRRYSDRTSYDAGLVHSIIDEGYVCHVGFVVDGAPRVLPTLHARIDDVLYLHGSTGSTAMLGARQEGLPVCVTVTLIDGLVLARSQFHHSANYRSVVAHGTARLVTDPQERAAAFAALVDKVMPGRAADSRPANAKELAQTALLSLRLEEVSAKVRAAGVSDDEADMGLPHWAGVVPLRLTMGRPEPDPASAVALPEYLRQDASPWHAAPMLRGSHVVLEPLDRAHAEGLFAALDHPDVWTHLTAPRPASAAEMAQIVAAAVDDPGRTAFVQKDPATGTIVGSTSYYAIDPARRSIAIGHTMLGRPWWRTAVNTESKLLLMGHAFDTLDAIRVEWHTDIRNERSQQAIVRLGAQREGVLRAHRQRPDGSWRDTVSFAMIADEWPGARDRLAAALAAGGR
ncbi:bifunctional pyridoxamine 5'-phosphate oxidase family protein/GNAT family N-acetyltransferase [Dactylosporangium sp. AC04546]|uniref:bifunctional pyridoxamine 5'-phosphate oxidase family protein/GNAT family N-acetyltransferase n=1 Tax=Dactylosporangium sp. AC04546 TaxID=2862460 RepID=UPI001EDF5C1D|nr:bifunctional pyridoxamine 5'-phosphate oxidase family protein/GNAT family N-acetyltransferase [Dactylosporangium sp. AC04546]WVK85345.1 bifunctional pyridoxamine 5'-phosphate oxidase family protein/GNAT family N-acetyltransferase [Dactylosporangium sp. AC04546]